MHIRKRTGITAMVDAMIFIVVMGLAVTALCAYDDNENVISNEASSISEELFSSNLRMCDFIETDDTRLVSMPDMVVFGIITGETTILEHIGTILRSLTQRTDAFFLNAEYKGDSISIGNSGGVPISSSIKEYTVTYGGTVKVNLVLY